MLIDTIAFDTGRDIRGIDGSCIRIQVQGLLNIQCIPLTEVRNKLKKKKG